jgi:hypothetical protein
MAQRKEESRLMVYIRAFEGTFWIRPHQVTERALEMQADGTKFEWAAHDGKRRDTRQDNARQ